MADRRLPLSVRLLVGGAMLGAAVNLALVVAGHEPDVSWLSPHLEAIRPALAPLSAAWFAWQWARALRRR